MASLRHLLVLVVLFWGLVVVADEQDTSETTDTNTQYGLTAEQINAIIEVELGKLTVDRKLTHDRWYKQVNGQANVYREPNGEYVRTIDVGFNFVTVLQEENGWTRINADEWVETAYLSDISHVVSGFTGFVLPETMPQAYTLAWALVNMYPSPAPNAEPSSQFPLIYRYTPLRIFASVEVDGYRWYQIGPEQWVHQYRVAKVTPIAEVPEGVTTDIWVGIDLYEQVLIAYSGTRPVFATLIATGLPRWPTYEGIFNIYYRTQREHMSWGTVGDDFYSLEEVPWTMYFDQGRALHGAYWHDGFGYRRSHGCVNISITDAKWLYDWVAEFMGSRSSNDVEEGPNVYVYSTDTYQE